MILTHGLKCNLGFVKGFSDISSKLIEHQQTSRNWGYIDGPQSCAPTMENIFYGLQSSAVIMKRLSGASSVSIAKTKVKIVSKHALLKN